MSAVPSFSFSGCLVGFVDAVFSLLFSFSQALGKPKPFWFGFPLVFSSSFTRTPSSTRKPCSTSTLRSGSRHCFLFVFHNRPSLVVRRSERDGAEGQDIFHPFSRNCCDDYFGGRRVRTDIPCVASGMTHRFGLTPPTPFLPNAVKEGPGRGWET